MERQCDILNLIDGLTPAKRGEIGLQMENAAQEQEVQQMVGKAEILKWESLTLVHAQVQVGKMFSTEVNI